MHLHARVLAVLTLLGGAFDLLLALILFVLCPFVHKQKHSFLFFVKNFEAILNRHFAFQPVAVTKEPLSLFRVQLKRLGRFSHNTHALQTLFERLERL